MMPFWPWGTIPIREKELKELEEKAKKLEAIKKLVETGPYPHMNTWEDYQRAVDDWLGKMMNVLEAEE